MTIERQPNLERDDPVIGKSITKVTPEMARQSVEVYLDQLSVQGLLHVRDFARNEVARQEAREDQYHG